MSNLSVTSYVSNNTLFYSSSTPGFTCDLYRDAIEEYTTTPNTDSLTCLPFDQFNTSRPASPLTLNVDLVNCNIFQSILEAVFGMSADCVNDDDFISSINIFCYYFVGLAVAALLIGYFMEAVFQVTAERQIYKMRLAYYRAVLRQDIAWFDVNASGEVSSRLVE